MKAWIGSSRGSAVSYALVAIDQPAAAADELLIRIRAVSINRVDQNPSGSHFNHSPPAPAAIPGLEIAGEVVSVGAGASGFCEEEHVTAMVQGGCAEYVRVKAALAIRVPPGMSWAAAAAIPVSYLTAHNALVTLGRLAPGGSVLIHAATSGVGLAALQLAALRAAAAIIGTTTSESKLERLRNLGATLCLTDPYRGFHDADLEHTGGRGVDVVIDNIGGSPLNDIMRCTALGGAIVNVGRLGGTEARLDLNLHALRHIRLLGATFRTRTLDERAQVVRDFLADHAAALANGSLAPVVDSVFAFDQLPAAMQRSVQREQFGKIVLEVPA